MNSNQRENQKEDVLLNRHVGESILELLNKGYTVQLEPIPLDMTVEGGVGRIAFMVVPADRDIVKAIQPVGHGVCSIYTLGEKLDEVRDNLRRKRGEPTLSEELAKLMEADAAHVDRPPVSIGSDACCSNCGSKRPLETVTKTRVLLYWDGGTKTDYAPINHTNILTCPDCHHHFSLKA